MLNSATPFSGRFLAFSLLCGLVCTVLLGDFQAVARPQRTAIYPQLYAARSPNLGELRRIALKLANRDRNRHGLSSLNPDPFLDKAAQNHVEDMLRRNYFNHVSPEGRTATDRFAAVGGQGSAGENLAILQNPPANFANPSPALLAYFEKHLLNSPQHRLNLLNPQATRFGFGIAVSRDRIYVAQLFSTQK